MHFSLPYTAATDRGHPHTISLKLRDINQLFNSMVIRQKIEHPQYQ